MNRAPRVLMVDDDPIALLAYAGLLSAQHYEFETAPNGDVALARIRKQPPDVVLLDLMMPGLDGFAVCRQIKADRALGFVPVVLITALSDAQTQAAAVEAGADDFLPKPVSRIELTARVRSMLRIKEQYEELQKLMRMREDLSHMIVHDMRSPLQIIEGLSQMLIRFGPASPEALLQDLGQIRSQAGRLRSFVDEILMVAKMENDRLSVKASATDLSEMLARCTQNWAQVAGSHQLTLRTEAPVGLSRAVDLDLVLRVLDNLISNAIRHSPPNREVVVRWLGEAGSAGGPFTLEVEDQGPGVPEEARERIFQRYTSVDLRGADARQIGLGLTFCKLAAEAHGGAIAVERGALGGALFRVSFPG